MLSPPSAGPPSAGQPPPDRPSAGPPQISIFFSLLKKSTTKIQREDTQRETKKAKMGWEMEWPKMDWPKMVKEGWPKTDWPNGLSRLCHCMTLPHCFAFTARTKKTSFAFVQLYRPFQPLYVTLLPHLDLLFASSFPLHRVFTSLPLYLFTSSLCSLFVSASFLNKLQHSHFS